MLHQLWKVRNDVRRYTLAVVAAATAEVAPMATTPALRPRQMPTADPLYTTNIKMSYENHVVNILKYLKPNFMLL